MKIWLYAGTSRLKIFNNFYYEVSLSNLKKRFVLESLSRSFFYETRNNIVRERQSAGKTFRFMNMNHIPNEKAWYITGFTDGEGSFNVSFRIRTDYLIGWKITPVFNISQKERNILALIKKYLKCGTIRYRSDNVWVYEVENQNALREIIVPFFRKYGFLSDKKKKDFARFQKILKILDIHKSKTYEDVKQILYLLDEIQSKSSRKYTNQQILERAEEFWKRNQSKIEYLNHTNLKESSETTRQTT